MGDLVVKFLSAYNWVWIVFYLVFWTAVRWIHWTFNRSNTKRNVRPSNPLKQRIDLWYRYFRRRVTGRHYEPVSKKLDIYLFMIFVFSVVLVPVGLFVRYAQYWFITPNVMEWGVIGDFFGGMLNPILAFASFIALLYTIRMQSEELRLTRKEFEKSVRAQKELVDETKHQRDQIESQIKYQKLQDDWKLCIGPLRDKLSLIRQLLFEVEDTVEPNQSLHGLFERAQKDIRIQENKVLGIKSKEQAQLTNIRHSEVRRRFKKIVAARPLSFFPGRIKRVVSELELADYLMGQLIELDATDTAINTLHAELGMPAVLCEMLDGYGFAVPNWKYIETGFYLDSKRIVKDKQLDTPEK